MSPPKNRKNVTPWCMCDDCNCVISSKDTNVHKSECLLPLKDRTHGFISEKVLHGFVETVKLSDIPEHLRAYKADLVLISQSAIELCDLVVGSCVQINGSIIKKVWPTADGSIASIKFFSGAEEGILSQHKVTLRALPSPPLIGKVIKFTLVEPVHGVIDTEALLSYIQKKFVDKIFFMNNYIKTNFLGKSLTLEIKDVSIYDSCDLETKFSKLDLDAHNECVMSIETTVWKIYKEDVLDSEAATLQHVGGYSIILDKLKHDILLTLQASSDAKTSRSFGILLHGPSGCGKTLISEALSNDSKATVVKLLGGEVGGLGQDGALRRVREATRQAVRGAPAVILLDDVDRLLPNDPPSSNLTAAVLSCLDAVSHLPVVVLATALSPECVQSCLRRPFRLEVEVELGVPTMQERAEILAIHSGDSCSEEIQVALGKVAAESHGCVGADLAGLCAAARSLAAAENCTVSGRHFLAAAAVTPPSAMRDALISHSAVRWEDIGGMEEVKMSLRQAVEWPILRGDSFTRLGITPPKGVLLYGPPGCSKTMIAKAIATETNLNFISVKGSEIYSKWVGESERSVREIFARARRVAPAVLFLDEVDSVAATRDSNSSQSPVHDRVLSQILTELDGVHSLMNVVIIAATNRPDRIDKAFLRPGRLDRLIYVPLPDLETRTKILRVRLSKMPTSEDVNIEEIAAATPGYSGAEVVAACNEAAMAALKSDFSASLVEMSHFKCALEKVTPRTPKSLINLYDKFNCQDKIS